MQGWAHQFSPYEHNGIVNIYDLSPRSISTYLTHVNCWIDPTPRQKWQIGAIRLRDLTDADAGQFIVDVMDRDRRHGRRRISGLTVRACLQLMRTALGKAVVAGILTENPFQDVRLPRVDRSWRKSAPPGRNHLLRLTACPGPRVRLLLLLAAYTGARRSELLGLTWENIDLRNRRMTISASLDQQSGELPTLKALLKNQRTIIDLPAVALAELRIARLAANKRAVETDRRIGAMPVLPNSEGDWWNPATASSAALRALQKLGIPGSLRSLSILSALVPQSLPASTGRR
jgi:integrase